MTLTICFISFFMFLLQFHPPGSPPTHTHIPPRLFVHLQREWRGRGIVGRLPLFCGELLCHSPLMNLSWLSNAVFQSYIYMLCDIWPASILLNKVWLRLSKNKQKKSLVLDIFIIGVISHKSSQESYLWMVKEKMDLRVGTGTCPASCCRANAAK